MGLFSWFKGNKEPTSTGAVSGVSTAEKSNSKAIISPEKVLEQVPDMNNGAVEVTRPASNIDVTVFEFGSVAASSDKVTLAGYCPVSDDLEPCRWEILPATGSDAPQFRVVF